MKNKKRKVQFILKVILLIEVVVLLVLLATVSALETRAAVVVEINEIQPQITTNPQVEEIHETEMSYNVTETEPLETICVITNEDSILATEESEEDKEPEEEEEQELEVDEEWIVTLTEKEFQDFCILVFSESGAEIEEGQIAVAATVINRMLDPQFPDTFYGVIYQPSQFSCVRKGYILSSITEFEKLPEITVNAVKRALEGEDPAEDMLIAEAERLGVDIEKYATGGALYFYNSHKCGDRNCTVQIDIGNHTFTKVWKR